MMFILAGIGGLIAILAVPTLMLSALLIGGVATIFEIKDVPNYAVQLTLLGVFLFLVWVLYKVILKD